MITWNDVKAKAKEVGVKVKEKAKAGADKAVEYINAHDEMVRPIAIGIAGVVGGLIAGYNNLDTREAAHCVVEDDITGCEFRTKHALTNNEILELGDRMTEGQMKGYALKEMGLLKKEKKRR